MLAVAVTFVGPAWLYDAAMAQSYAKLFTPVKGEGPGKALHLIKPDAFLNKVKAKEPLVVLDVRIPAGPVVSLQGPSLIRNLPFTSRTVTQRGAVPNGGLRPETDLVPSHKTESTSVNAQLG